ncbi:LOW QUALITY PROTEIN: hypothetical protein TorRG33x02_187790 [Trema orientale]|uniref:Uncharacterized protein n=1 Tax=Trema orientale TaxID=63057 RepID=A0A2P5EIK6_TREOI|nr:LOW QUALITY PROTEIN: hypothetical protein TorRG33x02_187790 [Trema orientale]
MTTLAGFSIWVLILPHFIFKKTSYGSRRRPTKPNYNSSLFYGLNLFIRLFPEIHRHHCHFRLPPSRHVHCPLRHKSFRLSLILEPEKTTTQTSSSDSMADLF